MKCGCATCAHAANDKYNNNGRPYNQEENPVSLMCSLRVPLERTELICHLEGP